MSVQLGIEMARPTRRFPALAPGCHVGVLEHHIEGRIVQHAIEIIQRLFDDVIQDHHHRVRRSRAHVRFRGAAGIQRRHQIGARFQNRCLRALARGTCACEQDDALADHEPVPSPTRSTPSRSNTLRMSSTSWYGLPR